MFQPNWLSLSGVQTVEETAALLGQNMYIAVQIIGREV
jgi:hypothetical protein